MLVFKSRKPHPTNSIPSLGAPVKEWETGQVGLCIHKGKPSLPLVGIELTTLLKRTQVRYYYTNHTWLERNYVDIYILCLVNPRSAQLTLAWSLLIVKCEVGNFYNRT